MDDRDKISAHDTPDFVEFLAEIDSGQVAERLTAELREVVEATQKTHKQGVLSIKISVGSNGGYAVVTVETSKKLAQDRPNGERFYFGHSGALLKEDPRQQTLPLNQAPPIRLADMAGMAGGHGVQDDADGGEA